MHSVLFCVVYIKCGGGAKAQYPSICHLIKLRQTPRVIA